MKLFKTTVALFIIFSISGCAELEKAIKDVNTEYNNGGVLTNAEIIKGLKEALTIGSRNSAGNASKTDGYFLNPLIKIVFPPEAAKMESTLRNIGLGTQVDQFVMALNRAAEDAAKKAAPVFVNAITNMTITDGLNILRGSNDAATQYLKNTTSEQLKNEFNPIIQSSIDAVQVTKYWSPLVSAYNNIPLVTPVNPNLQAYVTQKALDGLFTLVAQEELKIRRDPAARVTAILKKVFR